MEMLISFSSWTWHLPTPKDTKSWFNDHGVTVLDWPANSPDLNPIENLWGIVKRKMRDTRPNNADDLKAAIKATLASITPEQCHRLITSILSAYKWTYFSEAWHFCVKYPFLLILCNILIFGDTEFWSIYCIFFLIAQLNFISHSLTLGCYVVEILNGVMLW